jgi:pimeloyl-ACP methyl ester carboxylesterase
MTEGSAMATIEPFTIAVPDDVLVDLRARLRTTRWPDQLDDTTWEHGADLTTMRSLATTWADTYDWRAVESALNAEMPGLMVTLGEHRVHVARVAARGDRDGVPIVLLHGWPSSFVEMRRVASLLADQGHDVCVPSLPGHGFSSIPRRVGFGADACGALFVELMVALGVDRYVVHGGDRGSFVATSMGALAPNGLAGIHLTLPGGIPGGIPGDGDERTAEEDAWLADTAAWSSEEGGYSAIQGTRPQSLAYGMHDSPVATLAWLVEKHRAWIDGDDLWAVFTPEQLLTNATIYWITETFRAASHWYWEHRTNPPAAMRPVRIEVPTAVIRYPAEVMRVPPSAVARKYDLVRWTDRPAGGHFAAYEDPDALAADVHEFATTLTH